MFPTGRKDWCLLTDPPSRDEIRQRYVDDVFRRFSEPMRSMPNEAKPSSAQLQLVTDLLKQIQERVDRGLCLYHTTELIHTLLDMVRKLPNEYH